jgi:predicted ribosome quality control (RQC) complex YloA/Tae2 family protein
VKKDLSSMDLYFLLKELEVLIGSKVDQIYQKEKEELTLQMHVTGKGKHMLKVHLPSMLYLTQYKGIQPETPPGFCTFLRRRLKNARLQEIKQLGFERILKLTFSTKEKNYLMFIELFSDGNIILCEEDLKIVSPLTTGNWKDRTIRGGIAYTYPKRELDFISIEEPAFSEAIKNSDKESIVKILAMDFGLGGKFAEELCVMAKLDKNQKKISDKEIASLYKASRELVNKQILPVVTEKDILPFKLGSSEEKIVKEYKTYNEALDETLTKEKIKTNEQAVTSRKEKEIGKVQAMINQQKKTIEKLEKQIDEEQKKGEKVYEKFQEIEEILKTINKAKEKYSWDEIKDKLKGHKVIKKINPKEKTVTVNIE